MMDGKYKLLFALFCVTILFILVFLAILLFLAGSDQHTFVMLLLGVIIGVPVLFILAWFLRHLVETRNRQNRFHYRYEIPLDEEKRPMYIPEGFQQVHYQEQYAPYQQGYPHE